MQAKVKESPALLQLLFNKKQCLPRRNVTNVSTSVAKCKEPHDQARIDRNRKAFMDAKAKRTTNAKGSNGSSNQNRGTKKKHSALADGTPLIKNKKGEYAPDLHAPAIAKKAVAACKKNSAQAQLNGCYID